MTDKVHNPCYGCKKDYCYNTEGVICEAALDGCPGDGVKREFVLLIQADIRQKDTLDLMRELQCFLGALEKRGIVRDVTGVIGRGPARYQMIGWRDITHGK